MFIQFDKDKPGLVMLSPELEEQVTKNLAPEVKSTCKVKMSSPSIFSAGHNQEGFWLCHESNENSVKLFYPNCTPATYRLPNAWK